MATKNKSDDIECGKAGGAPGTRTPTCGDVNSFYYFGGNWALPPNADHTPAMMQFPFWVCSHRMRTTACQHDVNNSTIHNKKNTIIDNNLKGPE